MVRGDLSGIKPQTIDTLYCFTLPEYTVYLGVDDACLYICTVVESFGNMLDQVLIRTDLTIKIPMYNIRNNHILYPI